MSLLQEIQNFKPLNQQEMKDKELILQYMQCNKNYLERTNQIAHFTTSIWIMNADYTKTLMVYHNIYNSWSWIGGHADGEEDLKTVALRELQEETGVNNATLVQDTIFSVEILTVNGHKKHGVYIPGHLHFNVTYLAVADEQEELIVNKAENKAVQWWPIEEVKKISKEPWMIQNVYQKLIERCKQ